MATLIQHTNFSSAPITTPPSNLNKPHKNPLIKVSQKPTTLQSALFSFTNKLSFSTPNTPLDEAYASVLDHCATQNSPSIGKQIHTHIIKRNNAYDLVFLGTKLVFMYGKCKSLSEAEHLFDEMPERSIFTYNAMLGAYVINGEPMKAIELYFDMRFSDIPADSHTCSCVLKACSGVEDMYTGKEIHGYAIKLGFLHNDIILNSLVNVYANCNDINAAELLFERSERTDVVSWNLMISAYVANGMDKKSWRVFSEMQNSNVAPTTYTFVAALQACEDLSSGAQIHALASKSCLCHDRYVGNALVVMYSKFGKVDEAKRVFLDIHDKDNVSWNSMLDAYVENGPYDESFNFFREIIKSGRGPDRVSIISILSACGRSRNVSYGMEAHAFALKNGLGFDLQIGNTILDMYAKCCKTGYMDSVFRRITEKDYISWTTIISGYVLNHLYVKALQILKEVISEGINIDKMMVESVLLACRGLKRAELVKQIHGYILRRGLSDIVVQNTIVDVYGQCGEMDYARKLFKLIELKNVVTWTSMMACYVHNGLSDKALELSFQMVKSGVELDSIALLSILSAVANLSALSKGKEIHGFLVRKCMHLSESIPSSLIDMYASCGALDSSYKVFNNVEDKDLVLWTSMINAYGMHGHGTMAIKLFKKMEAEKNVRPDHIAFLAILHACSHSSLVDEGKLFFNSMEFNYGLDPWPEHCACLIDLLSRANCLEEAFGLVKSMKASPTPHVWSTLLGACRTHSNMEIGEIAAKKILETEPENPGNYVLVSNFYALAGKWDDVEKVRMKMKIKGLKKDPGCSWIEVKNKVHTFTTRDKSHPRAEEIYEKLNQIIEKLERDGGYRAETRYVTRDVEEREKVKMLYGHSERLALAYGLLSTGRGTAIRVTKNLRVCGDCHTFTKLVSKFFEREIVVRDANRFHHFRDGVCSCGDFW
ncbi:pentatricopeptide repeat-containing protein at3g63370 [Phtheirospermum japonicum]|uniref:Pentatricopeptide repeat-containing protein at3g63370 n=1 Tax=Phtheirospermum japonicum TaxID=374723 RepID=A0A830CIC1_9LAMI|nr:pentatricopeptide repeat-containing protein at3g63370 [Phtheirospermum japonicum]